MHRKLFNKIRCSQGAGGYVHAEFRGEETGEGRTRFRNHSDFSEINDFNCDFMISIVISVISILISHNVDIKHLFQELIYTNSVSSQLLSDCGIVHLTQLLI